MLRIDIHDDIHAIVASQNARRLAENIGFTTVEQAALSTAILELTRNVVKYAGRGAIELMIVGDDRCFGISAVVSDNGPGIPNIEQAMVDGFSTGKTLGLGLAGAKRLVSSFELHSQAGHGTTVKITKWKEA